MKKILPSILILLIIVNIFAPFSVGVDSHKNLAIKKSVAEAGQMGVSVIKTSVSPTSYSFIFKIHREKTKHHKFIYIVTDKLGTTMPQSEAIKAQIGNGDANIQTTDLVPTAGGVVISQEKYDLGTYADESDTNTDFVDETWPQTGAITVSSTTPATTFYLSYFGYNGTKVPEGITGAFDVPLSLLAAGQDTNNDQVEISKVTNSDSYLPSCGIADSWVTGGGTLLGCVAQLTYYVLFVPTSYIFGLAGMFFDTTFNYSIQDKSYNSSFVVEGWGLIRDFCNIFFIFILIYIAFTTILGLGHSKPKEMIINVVIIGLLINFSLFTAQLVIDTSNILARVFYNSDAIKVVKDGVDQAGKNGTIPISESIVSKVDPQQLIINANRVTVIDKATNTKDLATSKTSGIGVGAFIIITLLSTAINVVGFIVFLSVGLMFVSRVIGLWFVMIFSPIAFFSYAVPGMQNLEMIGIRKWFPELLKLSFLAPVFIFFLYLILKFLETGLLGDVTEKSGIDFVVGIMIPFIFLMVLLWKAKGVAKDMSGKLGQGITGGIATVGGLALGGAALGTAMLGRKMIGSTMARASRGDTATQRYESGTARGISKVTGFVGSKLGLGKVFGNTYNAQTRTVDSGIGGLLNKKQGKVGHIDHARHEMDAIKEKAGLKGVDDDKISGVNEQKMKDTYVKEKKSMVESELRKNGGVVSGQNVESEDQYKGNNRNAVTTQVGNIPGNRIPGTNDLTDAAKKQVENTLNANYEIYIKPRVEAKAAQDYGHLRDESKTKVSAIDRTIARSNTATYDARNISQTKADKREGIFTKMSAGLIAGIAMGVRTGLKGALGVNHGSGQNDFLKDIGHTITEAMKSSQINVKVEESHGTGGGDAHNAGGGHH